MTEVQPPARRLDEPRAARPPGERQRCAFLIRCFRCCACLVDQLEYLVVHLQRHAAQAARVPASLPVVAGN
ncbi:MAG: hypothetical protein WKG07_20315 [Hymenobacter sp.]